MPDQSHAITVLKTALHNVEAVITAHERDNDEPESYEICREKARDYESAIAKLTEETERVS